MDGSSTTRKSETSRELEKLTQVCTEIISIMETLSMRLNPVVSPIGPEKPMTETVDTPIVTDLGGSIAGARLDVERAISMGRSVLSRLEI